MQHSASSSCFAAGARHSTGIFHKHNVVSGTMRFQAVSGLLSANKIAAIHMRRTEQLISYALKLLRTLPGQSSLPFQRTSAFVDHDRRRRPARRLLRAAWRGIHSVRLAHAAHGCSALPRALLRSSSAKREVRLLSALACHLADRRPKGWCRQSLLVFWLPMSKAPGKDAYSGVRPLLIRAHGFLVGSTYATSAAGGKR